MPKKSVTKRTGMGAKSAADLPTRKDRAVKGGVVDYRESGLNESTHKRVGGPR